MSDTVERLRIYSPTNPTLRNLLNEAADEIEWLQSDNANLEFQREAIIANMAHIRAATIEECALELDYMQEDVAREDIHILLKAAAAIRALKA